MKIKILDPIQTSDLQYPDDVSQVVETCHELMNTEYLKMVEESLGTTKNSSAVKSNRIPGSCKNGNTSGHISEQVPYQKGS